jgi:hypothetical protein
MESKLKIFIKNSSSDINFGTYDLEVKLLANGGRMFKNREYRAQLFVDEEKGKLTVVVYDDNSGLEAFKKNVLKST